MSLRFVFNYVFLQFGLKQDSDVNKLFTSVLVKDDRERYLNIVVITRT